MSKEACIAEEIAKRIGNISVANGYTTDIGRMVFMGRLAIDPSSTPCAVVVEGATKVDMLNGNRCRTVGIFHLEGHADGDPEFPNVVGRKIVSDLKKAVFSGDLTFGQGVVSAIYKGRHIATREDGLKLASAAVMIELTYVENLAAP